MKDCFWRKKITAPFLADQQLNSRSIPASGSYVANGSTNAYTVAVEVTGSATTPPAQ